MNFSKNTGNPHSTQPDFQLILSIDSSFWFGI